MNLAVAIAILLAFLGLCLAGALFLAGRYGWKRVLQYLFFAIAGRIVAHFALSKDNAGEQDLLPLIWAGLIVWLLPHITRQRDVERDREIEAGETNEVSGE